MRRYLRGLVLGAVMAVGPCLMAEAADIDVLLDEARLIKLPDRVATVIVGNPSIADASVQAGGWMTITGKGFGQTNVVAVDRSGVVLLEKIVLVQGPREVVVVYRGAERNTYSCAPECERRLTLGDGNAHFTAAAGQITARNGLAISSAQAR